MGRSADLYMGGFPEFLYPWVLRAKRDALQIIGDAPIALPETAFVFFARQYEFVFFDITAANPSVYHYFEGQQAYLQEMRLSESFQNELQRTEYMISLAKRSGNKQYLR